MGIIILQDQPEDGCWIHCQYGHHATCGGGDPKHPEVRYAGPGACACHEAKKAEVKS